MLEALLSKNTTIPDSFNNCSTYFYEDFDRAKTDLYRDLITANYPIEYTVRARKKYTLSSSKYTLIFLTYNSNELPAIATLFSSF